MSNVHDGLKDGTYLCKVSGYQHQRFAVLRHSAEGWWQYVLLDSYGNRIEGWIGLDSYVKVESVLTLLEEDNGEELTFTT